MISNVMSRPTCPKCNLHPVALNYHRNSKPHYRSLCISCTYKNKKSRPTAPNWYRSGYRPKEKCERCGFKFRLTEQSRVYHVDGNDQNTNWTNLKTVCLNCQQEISKLNSRWRPGDLLPDF
jgi:hypothetical protein